MAKDKVLKKDDEKGIHDGHRVRLINLVDEVGLDRVSNIQALEFILFYVFPRGDVNPLAHRLLDRFNNVATVLEASIEDLKAVKGMGETSAKKLRSLLEIFYFYSTEKLADKDTLKTIGDFYDYIEEILRYRTHEEIMLFGVNSFGEVTKGRRFEKGTSDQVSISLADISLYISTHRVKAVILVHNHPDGSAMPSKQDRDSYERLKGLFNFTGCILYDMVIVGKDGIYSMEKECMQRIFTSGEEYSQVFDLKLLKKGN